MTRIDTQSVFEAGVLARPQITGDVAASEAAKAAEKTAAKTTTPAKGAVAQHALPAIKATPVAPQTAQLFGNMSEDEIALATALIVVRYEDQLKAGASDTAKRGLAALAETARMFEHLALLRGIGKRGDNE